LYNAGPQGALRLVLVGSDFATKGGECMTLPRQHLINSSSSNGASKQQWLQERCVVKLASTDGWCLPVQQGQLCAKQTQQKNKSTRSDKDWQLAYYKNTGQQQTVHQA
jgi:hypothetical protein